MIASRRRFLFGASAVLLAAPSIVRVAANLMPVSTRAIVPVYGRSPAMEALNFIRIETRNTRGALLYSDTLYLSGLGGPKAPDLFVEMAKMSWRTTEPANVGGRSEFSMPRSTRFWMDVQAFRDRNVLVGIADKQSADINEHVDLFRGIPIFIKDS